jgi:hypothetical protein
VTDGDFPLPPRTPEQIAADRARLERETAAERQRWEARGGLPIVLSRKREQGDLDQALQGIMAKAEDQENRRRALPCYEPSEQGDDDRAVDACEAARAFEGCEWAKTFTACPRLRAPDVYAETVKRLSDGKVLDDFSDRILEAARRVDRRPLLELDSLRLVRGVLPDANGRRRRCRVDFKDAGEAMPDGTYHANHAFLTGSERIVALIGNQGRGKSLATAYAIARIGGYYTTAPQWTRRNGVDYELAQAAAVLVVDQFGREDWGNGDWMRSQFEDVIDHRYQRRRLTFLVANLDRATLDRHVVADFNASSMGDRLKGEAVVVEFAGESIRQQLRLKALEGA